MDGSRFKVTYLSALGNRDLMPLLAAGSGGELASTVLTSSNSQKLHRAARARPGFTNLLQFGRLIVKWNSPAKRFKLAFIFLVK